MPSLKYGVARVKRLRGSARKSLKADAAAYRAYKAGRKAYKRAKKTYRRQGTSKAVKSQVVSSMGVERTSSNHVSRISQCEFVANIDTASSNGVQPGGTGDTRPFVARKWQINPGNNLLFPWLSPVAANYEEYAFRKLRFVYKACCGAAVSSTNSTMGTAGMTFESNALAPLPANKQTILSNDGTVSGPPYAHMTMDVPVSAITKRLYVAVNGQSVAGSDARLNDLGQVQFFMDGQQSVYRGGELWVEYVVDLMRPQIATTYAPVDEVRFGSGTITAAAPFGSASRSLLNVGAYDRIKPSMISFTTTAMTIRGLIVGTIIEYSWRCVGSVGAVQSVNPTSVTGGSASTRYFNGASYAFDHELCPTNGTTTTRIEYRLAIEVTSSDAVVITPALVTIPTGTVYGEFSIRVLAPDDDTWTVDNPWA